MLSVSDKLVVFHKLVSCVSPIAFSEYDARTLEPLSGTAPTDLIRYRLFSMDNKSTQWRTPDTPANL